MSRLAQIPPAIGRCWKPPAGLRLFERLDITARFALRQDGSLAGAPFITFSTMPADTRARELLVTATLEAFARCTPVPMTPSLAGAVAGQPISVHFIYHGPKGKGA